jgi:L-lactate dehydrogenase
MNDEPLEAPEISSPPPAPRRIAVIGAGNVGAATAFALLQGGVAGEVVLVDKDRDKAEGEAMDLAHAAPLLPGAGAPVRARAGGYADAAQAAVAVVTAGADSRPGETRLDLLGRNAPVVRECAAELRGHGFAGVLVVVTNPADVLALVAREASGLPPGRVIGSGTLIDTARLRQALAESLGVEPRAVHAFVLGEHGDSSVAALSCAHVAGVPLARYAAEAAGVPLDRGGITEEVRRGGYEVSRRKGHTAFAIAAAVTSICGAVLRDEKAVLAVSTLLTGQYGGVEGVYLGTPCVVGAGGVERVIELPLDDAEAAGLADSARVLSEAADALREQG